MSRTDAIGADTGFGAHGVTTPIDKLCEFSEVFSMKYSPIA
jgi:hypothetical protein